MHIQKQVALRCEQSGAASSLRVLPRLLLLCYFCHNFPAPQIPAPRAYCCRVNPESRGWGFSLCVSQRLPLEQRDRLCDVVRGVYKCFPLCWGAVGAQNTQCRVSRCDGWSVVWGDVCQMFGGPKKIQSIPGRFWKPVSKGCCGGCAAKFRLYIFFII